MTLRDMLERWRELDERAWAADTAVRNALVFQAGGGPGPTPEMVREATELRLTANQALQTALAPYQREPAA